jgi:hypothetical protein
MDFATFRKANPATRCFQRYSHLERADRMASHRLWHRQREAVGEYFYTHPMVPGLAFPTKKRAEQAAFEKASRQEA